MLDRLDYLQNLLPSDERNRVVPIYMFVTDDGLPVILRVNMGYANPDLPVCLVSFDIDPLATSIHCTFQYPTEDVTKKIYGTLTGNSFLVGTTEINSWSTLEDIVACWLKEPEMVF
ncbi:hypothetical protein [Enterovibrio paralichthyis]|uniref:hypothetical protein n=1 Tax=Enterovibrio paralichthyis TaxID=2853805 RepID=UPI001C4678EB|nr:hypothetical protein [Enterovibrio paralichthyis]MBV7300360.1 hypothetical protein [Enterovibrio paralichthyis]